jgi:hypothetical protein
VISSDKPGRETESSEATDRRVPADPVDPFASLVAELAALRDFALHFVRAQIDLAKWQVRSLAILAVAGLVAFFATIALAAYATILLLRGLAGGLAAAVGERAWLGALLAGVAGLGGLALVTALLVRAGQKRWKRRKADEYDARKLLQRLRHGRSVDDPAGGNGQRHAPAGSPPGS